ncbi:hypothetical protein BO78DRAFT_400413 [Aspergillus sclerotiicarbonarius CBS 121057]|uniref:Uncharacterized protein n=1 Tax=Aspergillus sclerotiicarbonarius (strain CBS 121057 / IBT 28362) TaxID=1448318 RepID=A0A319DZ53_ASPSB|nr:hypothetical protein BO78DRAFT_400413 [Aspergillus sclerotiicarbonarius CBS 121057]
MPSYDLTKDSIIVDNLLAWKNRLIDFFVKKPARGHIRGQNGFEPHIKCTITLHQTFEDVNFHTLILSHHHHGDFFILILGPEQASPRRLVTTMSSWTTTGHTVERPTLKPGQPRNENNRYKGAQCFAHMVGEKVMFHHRKGPEASDNEHVWFIDWVYDQDSNEIGEPLNMARGVFGFEWRHDPPPLPIRENTAKGENEDVAGTTDSSTGDSLALPVHKNTVRFECEDVAGARHIFFSGLYIRDLDA